MDRQIYGGKDVGMDTLTDKWRVTQTGGWMYIWMNGMTYGWGYN